MDPNIIVATEIDDREKEIICNINELKQRMDKLEIEIKSAVVQEEIKDMDNKPIKKTKFKSYIGLCHTCNCNQELARIAVFKQKHCIFICTVCGTKDIKKFT